ncbi:MAG: SDR family oxidoreductase [Candidatus Kariarchaeaceae archaeon]
MSIDTLLSLEGKVAMIGGSTSGIGEAIALRYAEAGAKVILLARNEEKLKNTLSMLPGTGHQYLVTDFKHPELWEQSVVDLLQSIKVDILVNNTGGPAPGPILEADIDEFMEAYKMHLVCNQILTRAVVPGMKELGAGRIINVISTSVRQPIDNLGVSNTTRGAVGNWAKTLASEIGKFNITVNNILPGPIRTPRMDQIINNRAQKTGMTPAEVEDNMASSVPLGRIGEPVEIANAALFLASSASSYISGTNIIVDGGRTRTY